jgi:dihydrofolate reductase
MATVLIDLGMSLDGFITGPNPTPEQGLGKDGEPLLEWSGNGTEPDRYSGFFKPSGASREIIDEMFENTGAILIGRGLYDIMNGWDANHPIKGVPVFLVTHEAPENIPQGPTPFVVVTDGIESAVKQAKAAAGDKEILTHGANLTQQLLNAGLVDELLIHIVPLLLGEGTRLFDHLKSIPVNLEIIKVTEAPGVTHLRYRVVK